METMKKRAQAAMPSHSLLSPRRAMFPQNAVDHSIPDTRSLTDTDIKAGYGHDFSNISVMPAKSTADKTGFQPVAQPCPLGLASPRACPFGGACHTCPVKVQTKLVMNQPGDMYEQEADRMADQAMQMPAVQLQRYTSGTVEPDVVPATVHEVLRSPGQPLDPTTRAFMEPQFGYDFSHVRVHTDAKAAESARAVNALAYTIGPNVVFDERKYAPESTEGSRLLAHELTHVIQQHSAAPVASIDRLTASSPSTSSEHEAERISNDVMSATVFAKSSIHETTPSVQLQGQWREKLGGWWQKIKQVVGAEPDEEKLLSELNNGLKRSQKLCEIGSIVESNPEAAERLKQAGEKFGGVIKILGKGLSIRSAARDIVQFIDAIETLEGLDIQKDPEKAAVAFGRLFASAGRLGKRLPDGPWSGYFEWLANSENFFTNMRRAINPEERPGWKHQFEEMEK